MRKWPSGRCRQNSLSLYIKSLPRNFFPVRQLFSEYRWSSRQVPVWFSGCNKHSTARTPQVIQLPAARFRQNDATDNRVSNSLQDYRNCRKIPNKPSASIAATDKAVRTFRFPFLCFPLIILKTDIKTLKTEMRHY